MKKTLLLLFATTLTFAQPHVVFNKYFGGTLGNNTEIFSIQKTSDGGYIIAGNVSGSHPEAVDFHENGNNFSDGFVVKLSSTFELTWSKCYGTTSSESIKQIKQTSDGNYVFVGTASNDYWIAKISATGSLIWEKKYGGSAVDNAKSILEKPNGEFIVSGSTFSTNNNVSNNFGFDDYWVLNLDSSGNLLSNTNFGGARNDTLYASVLNSDNTYVVAGESATYTGQVTCRDPAYCASSWWITKIDTSNNIIWTRCISPATSGINYFNTAYNMIKTSDGGYLVVGRGSDNYAPNSNGGVDIWAVKLTADGSVSWRENYGGSDDDRALAVNQTIDGGYIIGGYSYSTNGDVTVTQPGSGQNAWLIKTNPTGTIEWQKTLGSNNIDLFNDVIQINAEEYVAVGRAGAANGDCADSAGRRFWLTKISTATLSNTEMANIEFKVSPIPTNGILQFETNQSITRVAITDMSGRKVFETSSDEITEIDIAHLTKGIYLLKVANENNSTSRKIIKN